MVKILLVCSAGMSTSLLVENMKKAAQDRGIAAEIVAEPVTEYEKAAPNYDVVLLGPQTRFRLGGMKQVADELGIPIAVIDTVAYGTVDGEKALNQALGLIDKR